MSGVSKGTFALNTSTGNQTVSTGLSSAPKVLILWVASLTAAGYGANVKGAYGFVADNAGTLTQGCYAVAQDDAVTPTNTGLGTRDTRCLIGFSNGTPTVDFEISIVSLNSGGGFTINVDDAPGSSWIVHYLALDASVVNKAKVVRFSQPGATGAQSVTGVGFQPDLLLSSFANCNVTDLNRASNFTWGLGATDGTTQAFAAFRQGDAQATSDAISEWETSYYIGSPTGAGGNNYLYSITSFDVDGWTHNCSARDSGYTHTPLVLAIKKATGASVAVATDTQKTSTGTKTTTLGFQPDGALFATSDRTATGVDLTQGPMGIGGTDFTNHGAITLSSDDAVSPSDENMSTSTTVDVRMSVQAQTTNAEAVASAVATGVSLNWTTADATARAFFTVGFGAAAQTPTGAADLGITIGVSSVGTPKAYGASASTFTVGVVSSAVPKAFGVSASTFTVGIASVGSPKAYGVSASAFTLDISTSGTAHASSTATTMTLLGLA